MNNTNDSLLKNSLDSIQIGFEDYFNIEKDDRRIISSIRNLHAGILLFLKWLIKKNTPDCSNSLIMQNHAIKIDDGKVVAIPFGNKTIGREDIIDRLKIVGIDIDESQKSFLNKIGRIRNDIEHHFSNYPKQELEISILDAFWLLKGLNETYHKASNQSFFGKKSYNKLISLEVNYIKQKSLCFKKWVELDFKKISSRLPEKIFDSGLCNYYHDLEKIIKSKNIIQEEEINFYSSSIIFFSSIPCPVCKSELVEPTDHDFNHEIKILMHCTLCDKNFTLKDIIENYLEGYYAHEIMKVGSKGGMFALGRCPSCKLGAYLNFDEICMYCGNKDYEPEDPNFEYELQVRNVNLHSDKWD